MRPDELKDTGRDRVRRPIDRGGGAIAMQHARMQNGVACPAGPAEIGRNLRRDRNSVGGERVGKEMEPRLGRLVFEHVDIRGVDSTCRRKRD